MKRSKVTRARFLAIIGLFALLAAGCKEYDIDVTVEPGGGGSRRIELTTSSIGQADAEPSLGEFRTLFGLNEEKGWRVSRREAGEDDAEGAGPSGYIFTLERGAAGPADWNAMSGDIDIRAAYPGDDHCEVKFRNTVAVEMGRGTGARSITYRETFGWESLKEELVDFFATWYHDSMAVMYPELDATDLAELRGLMSGYLAMGLQTIDETGDFDAETVAVTMVPPAVEIIRRRRDAVEAEQVREVTEAILSDSSNKFERFTAREMPGVGLAFFTEIDLSVTMPGRIVDSNAGEVNEKTAIWRLDIMKTINKPVELFVRSELEE